jgi:hypothetical protein
MMQTNPQTRPSLLLFLLLLFLIAGTAGCVSDWPGSPLYTEPSVKPSTTGPAAADVLSTARVRKRITALEDFLAQESPIQEEQARAARELLNGYRRILGALKTSSGDAIQDEQRISALLFERLVALEERYFQEKPADFPSPGALRILSREKDRIRDAYLSGDHEGVVLACRRLEERYGAGTLSAEMGLLFAASLAETGEVSEAIRVGERILPELQGRPGRVDLHNRLVAWYLESGRPDQAREHYERLVDAVYEDRRILDRADTRLKSAHAAPARQEPATTSPESPEGSSSEVLDELLRRVDALVAQKAFSRAKLLLIRHRLRTPEGPQTEAIDGAMDRLEREEQAFETAKRLEGQDSTPLEQSLEQVHLLLESEKYEEAFQQLDQMEPPEGLSPELQALRDRAVSGIIGKKRNEAARAFLMAKNSSDPDLKKEHLRTAYNLLKTLVDRFPTSPLLPKVQSNLDTVRSEMQQAGIPPEPPGKP